MVCYGLCLNGTYVVLKLELREIEKKVWVAAEKLACAKQKPRNEKNMNHLELVSTSPLWYK